MVKLEEYLQKLHLTTMLDGLKDPDKNDIDHYRWLELQLEKEVSYRAVKSVNNQMKLAKFRHGSKTTYFGIHMREKSYPLLASLIIMKYSEIKKSKQVF